MSMSATGLQNAIKSALQGQSAFTVSDDAVFDQAAAAISGAIINYITANAEVTVTVTSGSSSGTYTGTIS